MYFNKVELRKVKKTYIKLKQENSELKERIQDEE